jgi:hypothetical protein
MPFACCTADDNRARVTRRRPRRSHLARTLTRHFRLALKATDCDQPLCSLDARCGAGRLVELLYFFVSRKQ